MLGRKLADRLAASGPLPISPAEHVEIVRSLGLAGAGEERILGRNAEDLYGLER